jgi:hypothetical protein
LNRRFSEETVTRKPNLALVGLAVAVLIVSTAGLAQTEDHEIRLTRPMKKGDKYWLMAKGTRTDFSVMTKEGEVVREDELTIRIELQAILEILEVDDAGRPLKEVLNIQYFVYGLGGELTEAMATGAKIYAETVGLATEFSLSAGPLPALAEAALEIVVSTYRGDVPDEDLIFGTVKYQQLGNSWPINAEAFSYAMRSADMQVNRETLQGETTLVGAEKLQEHDCLRVEAKVEIPDFVMTGLPPGVEFKQGKAEISVSGLFPTDLRLPKLQDRTSVEMEMVLKNNEGAMAGAVLETRSSRSGEKTLLPFLE